MIYDVEVYESWSGNIAINDFLESFNHKDLRKFDAIKHSKTHRQTNKEIKENRKKRK